MPHHVFGVVNRVVNGVVNVVNETKTKLHKIAVNTIKCAAPGLRRCECCSQFQYTGINTHDRLRGFFKAGIKCRTTEKAMATY